MRRQLLPAVRILLVFTLLVGLAYPLAVTGVAQLLFPDRADGSLVTVDGTVVGSHLQGQVFIDDAYFDSRPSAGAYDGTSTGGSNLGPTHPELLAEVAARVSRYRERNRLSADVAVPVDAVTASGSGLDPHIGVANARLQAPRVAAARARPAAEILQLVDLHTQGRTLGFLGEPTVHVLDLNLALDATGQE